MGIITSPVLRNMSPVKKQQQYGMRNKYHQVDGKCHKKMQTIKLGCDNSNKNRYSSCWKIKKILKLRCKMGSPLNLWRKFKSAYLSLSSSSSNLNTGRRIPKARKVHPTYTQQEFQDRLIFEIYKNMVASRELATTQ